MKSLFRLKLSLFLILLVKQVYYPCGSDNDECEIPEGFKIYSKHSFDVNGDYLKDSIFIIKATQIDKIVKNRFGNVVDRNRRGILIYLNINNNFELTIKNFNCFSSENEDGGVYFPPELSIEPYFPKGIIVHYAHGRYGHWGYKFRYSDFDLKLVWYYSAASTSGGIAFYRKNYIDIVNQKKITKINVDRSGLEENERYETKTEKCMISKPFLLSNIIDFDEIMICE